MATADPETLREIARRMRAEADEHGEPVDIDAEAVIEVRTDTLISWAERLEREAERTPARPAGGWVAMNAARTRFRTWQSGFPEWTTDVKAATRYLRRVDVEQVHAEDEDTWAVVELDEQDRPR